MKLSLHHEHSWDIAPRDAVVLQKQLAGYVRSVPLERPPRTVAGVDVSVQRTEVQAAVVVLALPSLEPIDKAVWRGPVEYPYVPGLLSFREIPALLRAIAQLETMPDLFMADAQGIAHPRRLGMASHLGVLLDHPVIGVAKSRLTGLFAEPGSESGAQTPLVDGDEVIGAVLRTRTATRPLFVSIGHRITLAESVALVLSTRTRYRLPEPTRNAHLLSRSDFR